MIKYKMIHIKKYKSKTGEEKTWETDVGAVFEDDDGKVTARFLDTWVELRPLIGEQGFREAKRAVLNTQDDDFDSAIPF